MKRWHQDLLRDFSESPLTGVSPSGTHLSVGPEQNYRFETLRPVGG
jgi:hypothetical protein